MDLCDNFSEHETHFSTIRGSFLYERKMTPRSFFDGGHYSSLHRRRWNITTHERKICDDEIEIILFVVDGSVKS